MTLAEKLNVAGIVFTGFGASIAMFGIYKQTNGYFAFRPRDFFHQIHRVLRRLCREGKAGARAQIEISAELGRVKGENRGTSLIGFYCVLLGFLFQMMGSVLMLVALFAGGGGGATGAHKD